MTELNTVDTENESKESESSTVLENTTPVQTMEEVLAKLMVLESEKASNDELLKKLRKFEKENKSKAEQEAISKGEYKTLYEEQTAKLADLEAKGRDRVIISALHDALKDSGAKSISTAMKLIDKSQIKLDGDLVDAKSISKLVKELKESDPTVFEEETKIVAPSVKRSTEGNPVSGFEKEMRACRTQKEIESVMRKHGKI